MNDNHIFYEKRVLDGRIGFQLVSKKDYKNVCNLSLDIGQRALSIEANYLSDAFYAHETKMVAGHA